MDINTTGFPLSIPFGSSNLRALLLKHAKPEGWKEVGRKDGRAKRVFLGIRRWSSSVLVLVLVLDLATYICTKILIVLSTVFSTSALGTFYSFLYEGLVFSEVGEDVDADAE